jgi:hypothetical protein
MTTRACPNLELTPWLALTPFLKDFIVPAIYTTNHVTSWFHTMLKYFIIPLTEVTLKKKPSRWSKAWWNTNITFIQNLFHSVARAHRTGLATLLEVKSTKNAYFKAIRNAKQNHLNNFVKTAQPKELWYLHRLSKPKETDTLPSFPNASTAEQLNKTLVSHYFPPLNSLPAPPPKLFQHVPDISPHEITRALSKCSNNSTPVPDQIPYGTWKHIHQINSTIILSIISPLLVKGHYPASLRAAKIIVLPKPSNRS